MFFVLRRRRRVRRLWPQTGRKKYLELREHARAFVHDRIKVLNAPYGFQYNKIAIRNSSSRWGSCSTKKNLNFNYKIVLLPPELADYIIVHELCHLQELNHSPNFWALVAGSVPNYVTLRHALRKVSASRL